MKQIILPTDNSAGIIIYPAAIMNEIAMLDRFSGQSNLLKCSDLDLRSKNTTDVINWLTDNTPKLYK